MTDITSDDCSFVPIQSSTTKELPNDENSRSKVRKRINESPTADISNKKVSSRNNISSEPVLPTDCTIEASS